MNGGGGGSVDESRPCYYVRLTIPQKASSIPLTYGDLSLNSSAFVQTVLPNRLQTAEPGVDP